MPGGVVGALDERDAVAARGGVERDAGAGDAAADDDDVERLGGERFEGVGAGDHRRQSGRPALKLAAGRCRSKRQRRDAGRPAHSRGRRPGPRATRARPNRHRASRGPGTSSTAAGEPRARGRCAAVALARRLPADREGFESVFVAPPVGATADGDLDPRARAPRSRLRPRGARLDRQDPHAAADHVDRLRAERGRPERQPPERAAVDGARHLQANALASAGRRSSSARVSSLIAAAGARRRWRRRRTGGGARSRAGARRPACPSAGSLRRRRRRGSAAWRRR